LFYKTKPSLNIAPLMFSNLEAPNKNINNFFSEKTLLIGLYLIKLDELVKIRSNFWIPAFAGMTVFVTICNFTSFCHSRAGGNPGKSVNRLFTIPSTLS